MLKQLAIIVKRSINRPKTIPRITKKFISQDSQQALFTSFSMILLTIEGRLEGQ